jgi:hypothetical protein
MEKWRRRNYFIDKNFQGRFIIKFCIIVIISTLAIGVSIFYLSKSFTTVAIENAHVLVKGTSDFILPIIVQTIVLVTLLAAASVIALTLFTSHKIAGPLYRMKRDIEIFKTGRLNIDFRTRNTDQLKDLASAMSDMSKVLIGKHAEVKAKVGELNALLQKPDINKEAVVKKLGELESAIAYFKI